MPSCRGCAEAVEVSFRLCPWCGVSDPANPEAPPTADAPASKATPTAEEASTAAPGPTADAHETTPTTPGTPPAVQDAVVQGDVHHTTIYHDPSPLIESLKAVIQTDVASKSRTCRTCDNAISETNRMLNCSQSGCDRSFCEFCETWFRPSRAPAEPPLCETHATTEPDHSSTKTVQAQQHQYTRFQHGDTDTDTDDLDHALASLADAVAGLEATPPPASLPTDAGEALAPHLALTHGEWLLISHGDHLSCVNMGHAGGVALQLWSGSNGWLNVQTTGGQWVMYSDVTTARQEFTLPSVLNTDAPAAPEGSHPVGAWTVEVDGLECRLLHPENDFDVVLHARSNGWLVLRLPGGHERMLTSAMSLDDPYHVSESPADVTRVATGLFELGNWRMWEADEEHLILNNVEDVEGVLIRLWSGSNGWMQVQTHAGQAVIFSNLEAQHQAFEVEGASGASHGPLPAGAHAFGEWRLTWDGEDLRVDHPRNGFHLAATASSNGWVDLRDDAGGEITVYSTSDLIEVLAESTM